MRRIEVRSQARAREFSIFHSVQISLCCTDAVQWEPRAFSPEVNRTGGGIEAENSLLYVAEDRNVGRYTFINHKPLSHSTLIKHEGNFIFLVF
jgi:hypothetical protein